jgi:hypothetical protein
VIESWRAYYKDTADTSAFINFGKDDLIVTGDCRGQTYYFGEDFRLPNGMEYSSFEFETTTYLHGESTWEFEVTELETYKVTIF